MKGEGEFITNSVDTVINPFEVPFSMLYGLGMITDLVTYHNSEGGKSDIVKAIEYLDTEDICRSHYNENSDDFHSDLYSLALAEGLFKMISSHLTEAESAKVDHSGADIALCILILDRFRASRERSELRPFQFILRNQLLALTDEHNDYSDIKYTSFTNFFMHSDEIEAGEVLNIIRCALTYHYIDYKHAQAAGFIENSKGELIYESMLTDDSYHNDDYEDCISDYDYTGYSD